ncbi:hypothetical protein [uncultured Duncaniella sp.]|uniref:hypothetical protein n=1 Tax=uncultured Duncaniella sp. TaxID=2768039 RepID=UPI00265A4888|nr:hypothetical protein [uncultured Duncaniella sp.]
MKRKFTNYGGDRPCYTMPPVKVTGGFTLDPQQSNLAAGAVVPFGTLVHVDEATRLAKLIKSARVVAIGTDAKQVTLEGNEFAKPLFIKGDYVAKDLSAKLASTPKITALTTDDAGVHITLDKAITGLAVGDALFEVVANGEDVKLVAQPNTLSIGEGLDAEIKDELADTVIDVTRDSGNGEIYARRVPPVPASLLDGAMLKGTKVIYTNSL